MDFNKQSIRKSIPKKKEIHSKEEWQIPNIHIMSQ